MLYNELKEGVNFVTLSDIQEVISGKRKSLPVWRKESTFGAGGTLEDYAVNFTRETGQDQVVIQIGYEDLSEY
jgi:hypothetical protein